MTSNYSIIFNVDITHSYYKGGVCRDLIYEPSEATKSLMQRYGFKIINNSNGFSFLMSKNSALNTFLDYIAHSTNTNVFSFNISTVNSKFYQFTEQFSMEDIGYLQYTSNTSNISENTILLDGEFISTASSEHVLKLDVLFNDIILSKTTHDPINYSISLDARATQWHYNIINSSNQHFDTLSITSDTAIEFTKLKEIILPNAQVAQCFSSGETKIPLKESGDYNFDLVSSTKKLGQTRLKTIFKGLPHPDPGTLTINHSTKEITSLAYVYI